MDLRRRSRKRACVPEQPSYPAEMGLSHQSRKRSAPVRVHRDTLQLVLRSLMPPAAAASTSDSGAPSDGDSVADGPARVPVPLDHPEEDGNDSAFSDGELLAPEVDEDDPLAVRGGGPDPAPTAAGSANRRRRQGAVDSSPATRRAPPPDLGSEGDIQRLLHRASQHAVSSGRRREMVEAFQTLSLLLPWIPRVVWELAFSVCMTPAGGPGEAAAAGPQLEAILQHCLRHYGIDRVAAQLTAFSALAGAGRTAEALEMAATGRPRCRQSLARTGAALAVNRLLMQAMKEWARCEQSPPGEARLLHMRTLQGCLETLVAEEESLRAALEPLLRSVNTELERG